MVDNISFEGFFNAVFRSLAEDSFGNPGRTAMNASSFNSSELGVLPLRAFQMAVAYLVSEGELPSEYNDRASTLVTAGNANALLADIQRVAAGRILEQR